jgi:hypothetical protein
MKVLEINHDENVCEKMVPKEKCRYDKKKCLTTSVEQRE